MTTLQIINGAIDASWVLTGTVLIIGFFLVRLLNKMEKKIERQDIRLDLVTRVQIQVLIRLGGDDEFYTKLAEQLNSLEK